MDNTTRYLDLFTVGYVNAALSSTTNEHGVPLGCDHSIDDIEDTTLNEMVFSSVMFQGQNERDLAGQDMEAAGFEFWLSRNGHGDGFNASETLGEEIAERLHERAQEYGNVSLYEGANGRIS